MLVLTRKIGESVVIGDNVTITVVSVGPGRVKIGVEAPNWVSVDRQEVHTKKLAERSAEAGPPEPTAAAVEPDAVLQNRIADKLCAAAVAEAPAAESVAPMGERLKQLRTRVSAKPR